MNDTKPKTPREAMEEARVELEKQAGQRVPQGATGDDDSDEHIPTHELNPESFGYKTPQEIIEEEDLGVK
jgi:hypothetical protein